MNLNKNLWIFMVFFDVVSCNEGVSQSAIATYGNWRKKCDSSNQRLIDPARKAGLPEGEL
jgi:hypothetical protein